jgi:alanyl-tRNA synthetase
MKYRTSQELRELWIQFFKAKQHTHIPSASLVPEDDPTLLWINSGVAALKPYFDGSKPAPAKRLVNLQKCIRTNDIESVGHTARHQTLFEMVGHFSIGDYFKEEAMRWNLEFLTSEDYLGLPLERLYFTVYPTDHETVELWKKLGVSRDHIVLTEYNFWEIGSGPCGPNTEFFYDRGVEFGDLTVEAIEQDIENDRYIELGNIVFSQYNSTPGKPRHEYPELPQKNIDMGGGFERIVSVVQSAKTNFDTDLFQPIIQHIVSLTSIPYTGQMSYKIIADHIRTIVMALADGAVMSNEGRGYVLRRLLRRAMKHGRSLGLTTPFLSSLVPVVIDLFQEAYPEIVSQQSRIVSMIHKGEEVFLLTLASGIKRLESIESDNIDGQTAFELYDTYGFPIELTMEFANEHGKSVDQAGFHHYMKQQQDRARNARSVDSSMNLQDERLVDFKETSRFVGYETTATTGHVLAVFDSMIITDQTPFYAESGGQAPDSGIIEGPMGSYSVTDVQKGPNGQHIHIVPDHDLAVGDVVTLKVDEYKRARTRSNHSAIHLMYAALRQQLNNVSQRGSFVNEEYLRFDMAYDQEISDDVLLAVERQTNQWIKDALSVTTHIMSVDEAKQMGAIAEFGEKYSADVRVVQIGDVTADLCGGTHVSNTKTIDSFALASFESKGSGIYRFSGYTAEGISGIAQECDVYLKEAQKSIEKAKRLSEKEFVAPKAPEIQGSYQDVLNYRLYLKEVQVAVKEFEKLIQQEEAAKALDDVSGYDKDITGRCLVTHTHDLSADVAKQLVDRLLERLGQGTVFVVNHASGQLLLLAKTNQGIHCGNLVKGAAQLAGGNGGGKPEFAQAGAKDVTKINDILAYVKGELSCES